MEDLMLSPTDAPGRDFGAVTHADLAYAVHRRVRAFPEASQSYDADDAPNEVDDRIDKTWTPVS
jgi:hypothetical protein